MLRAPPHWQRLRKPYRPSGSHPGKWRAYCRHYKARARSALKSSYNEHSRTDSTAWRHERGQPDDQRGAPATQCHSATTGTGEDARLKEAAVQFEAVFVRQMLSSLEKAAGSPMGNQSSGGSIYGSMVVSPVADAIAHAGGWSGLDAGEISSNAGIKHAACAVRRGLTRLEG